MKLKCFKTYDIRGQLGRDLNKDIAYRIGRAFGVYLKPREEDPKTVVIGSDIRLSSEGLKLSIINGLMDSGVNVVDIGMTGTEEIYFATKDLNMDGGIEVTASHNPIDYNGMKLVREEAKPISGDTGLREIQLLAEKNKFSQVKKRGWLKLQSNLNNYVDHLMSYITPENIRPMKIVVNSGNGAAGHVIDEIEDRFQALNIPIDFIKVHHEPDGNFPHGIPNPLLPERRADTENKVLEHKADMGVAWDGDFDRCFLFDENGRFIEGYYIVGLLAEAFLQKKPGCNIIHDPRLTWNTIDIIKQNGGIPVQSKTGHAFIKERMRKEDAIYGGEMSAHHYFRDFSYCDSGMIPWLLVTELLSVKEMSLSSMVHRSIVNYPSSGEINIKITDVDKAMKSIYELYISKALSVDKTDGLSLCFNDDNGKWRFNLRSSNTEPLVRLNVETHNNSELLEAKTRELLNVLEDFSC